MSEAIEKDSEIQPVGHTTAQDAVQSGLRHGNTERRRRWRIVAIWCAIAGLLFGYMVVVPAIQAVIEATKPVVSSRVLEDMTLAENVRLRSAEFFGVAWFFAVGASFGSFLNVVAYRMPRGKSIGGSSHCPHCNVRLTRCDNVPILGWLMLGGRCRTCHQRISPRYLFVEALTGGLFLLFLHVELLSGGANIPFGRLRHYDGFVWIVFYPKWDVLGIYAYHMAMLCFLAVLALIEWDRLRTPKRLALAGLFVGSLFPAIWPNLHPVAWWMPRPEWLMQWPWLARFDTSLLGLIAGACIGACLGAAAARRATPPKEARCIRTSTTVAMALVGLFLGWQAALSVAVFAVVLQLLAAMLSYLRPQMAGLPLSGWVLASTTLHLCLWRTLSDWPIWPGPRSSVPAICVACVVIVVACMLARVLLGSRQTEAAVDVSSNEGALSS